ncbi:ricin-type beta-trefoil lectin domain protein [Kitasatospora aureofaciens]|uniref:ricin-type beta-trefoil lectin domain protein n=1 Tax=Kitasatospora aureofaciens TaxID=1894 RepID=UPI001C467BD9|nr:ricin-type beta-trefoil lectin domain protein [Kitasatospora aureofaciens]MBV6702771.1 ricin-type beta-trefoil lectin domain protein [Kitasatospora aureofaciens]
MPGLPVSLTPLPGSPVAEQAVTVDVMDAKAAAAAGIPGPVVSLSRDGNAAGGAVRLGIDTTQLGDGLGSDWASRAHLVAMPACSLTTPAVKGCLEQTPLASQYDAASKKLVADVPMSGGAPGAVRTMAAAAPSASATVVAAVSGPSGGAGTYAATSLNPSQAWTSGNAQGSFTYSYPIQLPPTLGGGSPQVSLAYDSSSVDGRTSSTNAQASWIGDGWDYNPGFVERSYKPCSTDGLTHSGDECWAGANATLSLAGHSGELVPDDASCQSNAPGTAEQSNCTWRIKGDDGTKVQFLTGATNGTWNGSYIKVTDNAGTVFYFGLNHLPDPNGNPTTTGADSGSAWTVPVYSPNSGDPCYDSSKGQGSWCQTAWRWNLDYVVDRHGNLTTYSYTPESNFYARGAGQNSGTGTSTSYTRGGVLASIGYGQLLSDQLNANGSYDPAVKVVFASTERCVTSTSACDPANRTSANAANWPDVPMDQQCTSTDTCTTWGPTFWSTKWLSSITTQVRVNGAYQDVDFYALNHQFVNVQNATENTQVPWLASVQRTAKDSQASAAQVTTSPVSFTAVLLPNRVDGTDLVPARPAFNRPRIQLITTEIGGTIGVDYQQSACSRVNKIMPVSADTDTLSCFNVKWHPSTEQPDAAPIDDWFLRYPVATVTTNPNTPGAVPMTVAYSYGNAAWHRNDSPLTKDADRTWDQFRGYASVTTVAGSGSDGPKTQKGTTFYQGMDGDITSSGTRSVSVAGPMSGQVTDFDWLSGTPLEEDTYTQAGGTVVGYTVNTSSGPVVTATHARGSLPSLLARYGATARTSTTKALKADGSWRATSTMTTTDPAHADRTLTLLDSADGQPDLCARTSYASGPDPQVTALVSETLSVSGPGACAAAPTAANTVSWSRTYFDSLSLGQAGVTADPTTGEVADHFDSSGTAQFTTTARQTFDAYGRSLTVTDPKVTDSAHPKGGTVTTAYAAPGAGELPSSITVTTPAPTGASDAGTGRATTTVLDSARGLPKTVTDPNGRTTTKSYDAMGRLTAVWLPGRDTAKSASKTLAYAVPGVVNGSAVPPTITATTLAGPGDTYVTGVELLDGLGRPIQTQTTPAISAYTGRIITDTMYDSFGRVTRSNSAWYNKDAAPGATLYQTSTDQVPAQSHTVYDGLGRPVTSEFLAYGNIQSTTTTAYPGADRTDVTPPAGSTPTSTVTDSRGRTTHLWQYKTTTTTGNPADADVTGYSYTAAGRPASHTDAAGNTWTTGYDLLGREISATDPDSGTSTKAYDADGRLASTTDARGQTITYTYDLLGRTTGSYAGTTADPAQQLTAKTYDSVVKGQPATSTRYVGGTSGAAYSTSVLAYDTAYHAVKSTTTIPGSEIGSTAPFTYTYQATYDPSTGLLTSDSRSAVGDIPGETVSYSYDAYGLQRSYGAMGGSTYDLANDYDAYGHPTRSTVNPWGTQIVVTNNYDESTGRQLSQYVDKQTAGTGAVQQTSYAYDPSGRITAIRTVADNNPSATDLQCFGYDYLSRLTTAWSDTSTLTMAAQPTVGGQGSCTDTTPTSGAVAPARTTVGGPAPYWQDYSYDLTGNRSGMTQHDPGGDTTKDAVTTQVFPAAGTVNTGKGTGGPHALTRNNTTTNGTTTGLALATYDASGNTVSSYVPATRATTMAWSPEGRLDTVTPSVQITGVGGKCLDLRGASAANGTVAQIYTCTSTAGGQKFNTTGNVLRANNKCLTAMGTAAGSAIQLQPCDGTASQTWTSRADGTLLNAASNRCLAVPGDVSTNSTATALADCASTVPAGQQWTIPNKNTTFVYDASGNQLLRRDPGRTTISLGSDELLYDTNAKTLSGTRYYQMPAGLTLIHQGGTWTYQISDNHGTGTLALDGTTLTETRRLSDPFGLPRGTQPSTWAGDLGFVGGTKDDATGLTNLGAREYQPSTGRFLSPDPVIDTASPQQWNGYSYSNNNPVNLSDPSGLHPEGKCDGTCQDGTIDLWGGGPDHWVYENVSEQSDNTVSIMLIDFSNNENSAVWTEKAPPKRHRPTSWGYAVEVPNHDRDFWAGLGSTLLHPVAVFANYALYQGYGQRPGDALEDKYDQWALSKGVEPESANFAAGSFLPSALDDPIGVGGLGAASFGRAPGEAALMAAVRQRADGAIDAFSGKKRPGMSEGLLLQDGTMFLSYSMKGKQSPKLAPSVAGPLNKIPRFAWSNGHGQCGLPQCITAALEDGRDPTGGTVAANTINGSKSDKHGVGVGACRSCAMLVNTFELKVITGPTVGRPVWGSNGW